MHVWPCSNGEREKRIVGKLQAVGAHLDNRGHTADTVAVAWLLHGPGDLVPIIGTTIIGRLNNQTVPASSVTFTQQNWQDVMSALY